MRQRLAIAVAGIVQGVGFRPYVHALATRLALGGFIRNQAGGVLIEVEGETGAVEQFLASLTNEMPPLARLERVAVAQQPLRNESEFRIAASVSTGGGEVFVSPDIATCPACLAELFDPHDRRSGYPFLNCTHCGPRLTIITGAPYDRTNTTMAKFAMCVACRAEYDDPTNRRFHAQPIACPACGPRLRLLSARGELVEEQPLPAFVAALTKGQIGALKGLGGYHLTCDARNEDAVRRLRQRKCREEKPFALMVADISAVEQFCALSELERALLESPRRPIVLLRRREGTGIASGVAPGNPYLGVMLPYTPLHHLLIRMFGGPLVMTSGNRSDEPIAIDDDDAMARLSGIADLFLVHDRPIRVRCDDSVMRIVGGAETFIRRSRGYAPEPIPLAFPCPLPVLAVGGQLKTTFALGRGSHAFLSHHLGDLDHLPAFVAFQRDVALYEQLFGIVPEVLVHDLHPDFATTRYAVHRAATGVRLIAVQHHHAHIAAGMAEHGLTGPVIGVAFDGTGYGSDGAIWGGEFLIVDWQGFTRVGHLRYVRIAGGDAAIREPWRPALTHLIDAGCDWPRPETRPPVASERVVRQMLARRLNAPETSSVGRLFDAIAALSGVRHQVNYEGQAAVELEWLATTVPSAGVYPFEITADGVIDTRPLIRAVVYDAESGILPAVIARRFHSTVVEIIVAMCQRVRAESGVSEVVLSGGVFLNHLLTVEASNRLTAAGFRVYRHERVPPSDGGLSLGQLAVAAHLMK